MLSNINLNCNVLPVNHNTNKLDDKDTNKIFLLRNPYDSIASAVELEISDLEKQKMYAVNLSQQINQIKELTLWYIDSYKIFIEKSKANKDVLAFTFEFLTQHTEKFINKVINTFDLKSKNFIFNEYDYLGDVKKQSLPGRDRSPREKSENRILIDNVIKDMEEMKPLYEMYLGYKKEIEETEND